MKIENMFARIGLAVLFSAIAAAAMSGMMVLFGKFDDFAEMTLFMFIIWLLITGYILFIAAPR